MGESMLLYDADCGFCTRAARQVPKLGLRLAAVPLQSVDLAAVAVDVDRARKEIPFVGVDGDVRYGADAIARALDTGNLFWRSVSRAMLAWPLKPVGDVIYGFVARHRHRFPGGTAACRLPR